MYKRYQALALAQFPEATDRLTRRASRLACVDASPEMIPINARRLVEAGLPAPRQMEAGLFSWEPDRAWNVVFFSSWLSHVPAGSFLPFWRTVTAALKPGSGRAFFVALLPD